MAVAFLGYSLVVLGHNINLAPDIETLGVTSVAQLTMHSLITAAARALAAGDPRGALRRVALRDDPPALAFRSGRTDALAGQGRGRRIRPIDPQTGAILRTIESNRFVTGVTWDRRRALARHLGR
jgi:hypothetical protein